MARGAIGGGLVAAGLNQEAEASDMLGKAADQEQERNIGNVRQEKARKAGNVQLGATAGATVGMAFGPVGAMVGGLLGAVGASLF